MNFFIFKIPLKIRHSMVIEIYMEKRFSVRILSSRCIKTTTARWYATLANIVLRDTQ